MLGLIPLSPHMPLCSMDGKLVIRHNMNTSRANGAGLTAGSDEFSSVFTEVCTGLSRIWCAGLQQLLYYAGRLFSIFVTSAVRAIVSPGSRASSCLLTAGTVESGEGLEWLWVNVLGGCRVCRNCWGSCTLRWSSITVVISPRCWCCLPQIQLWLWGSAVRWSLCWCCGALDAGPLNCCFCVHFFGETLLAHGTLCRAL